jgi:hypothetical protein
MNAKQKRRYNLTFISSESMQLKISFKDKQILVRNKEKEVLQNKYAVALKNEIPLKPTTFLNLLNNKDIQLLY